MFLTGDNYNVLLMGRSGRRDRIFLSQRQKSLQSLESLEYLESFVADVSTWSFGYLGYFVTTRNTPAAKWKSGLRKSKFIASLN